MEYLVDIIDSVAWPAGIIWLGYLFKNEIRKLFERVSRLKYGGIEATFKEQIVETAKKAESLSAEINTSVDEESDLPNPSGEKYDQLLRISTISSRAALAEAWFHAENALKEAAERVDIQPRRNMSDVLDKLVKEKQINEDVRSVFHDLRKIRNVAFHDPAFEPDSKSVERYLWFAILLSLSFQKVTQG
jgi:hypothetical protein